jgi:hypothetical protein
MMYSLFELNDSEGRENFIEEVGAYLEALVERKALYDWRIVCDDTNNPPEIVEKDMFVADLYLKPTNSINFIQLNFIATRTPVSFNEVVGAE